MLNAADIQQFNSTLLDVLSEAIVVVDQHGKIFTKNKAAENLSNATLQAIEKGIDPATLAYDIDHWHHPYRIHLEDFNWWIFPAIDSKSRATATLIEQYLLGLRSGQAPHRALGIAIKKSIGWQWVAVCKIVDDDHFEILTWIDGDEIDGPIMETLEGTACQIVLDLERFVYFKNIAEAFKDDEYRELGAEVYAGLAYQVNNEPFGHIFALHSNDNVDVGLADSVFTIASELIGTSLSRQDSLYPGNTAEQSGEPITGLGTLQEFEATLKNHENNKQGTLMLIQLVGLVTLRDNLGETFANNVLFRFGQGLKQLSQTGDSLYYIDDVKFAVIMQAEQTGISRPMINRLNAVLRSAIEEDFLDLVSIRLGVALVSEAGNFSETLELAKSRLSANLNASQ